MSFIDFEEVKKNYKIEDVAERLGLELISKNNQLRGECPVCGEGGSRAFCITPAKQRFYCFGCSTGGDSIEMVARIQGVHPKEAANWIAGTTPEEKSTKKRPKPSEGFKPLDYLDPEHDAVDALGITPLDAGEIGIGYAPRGVMRGTVAVPIRLSDGRLIGYLGVTEAIVPKEWKY